jgi:beta-lactamase superfamily II metal-dependent hydrolase
VPSNKRPRLDPARQAELDTLQAIKRLGNTGPLHKYLRKILSRPYVPGGDETRKDIESAWTLLESYTEGSKPAYEADTHERLLTFVAEATALSTLSTGNSAAISAQLANYTPQVPVNGELRITFLNVGSGDCILVRTPGGNTLAIDCGSRARAGKQQNTRITSALRDFLGGGNSTLFALILTHADQDHHKDADAAFFAGRAPAATNCLHIFYSLNIGNYSRTTASIARRIAGGTIANETRIRPGHVGIPVTSAPTPAHLTLHYDLVAPVTTVAGVTTGGMLQILGKSIDPARAHLPAWQEDHCQSYLLAAGVGSVDGAADGDPNPASIVTLIVVRGRKILLTGDAEVSTEQFLLARHTALLQDIDLLHVEHHGSGTANHASDAFVQQVDPQIAVISSGMLDHNPRWNLLAKYLDGGRLCTEVDEHNIMYGVSNTDWCDMAAPNNWTGIPAATGSPPGTPPIAADRRRHGIYTTNASGDLTFTVDNMGDLWRKWTAANGITYAYKLDALGNYTVYSVAADGTHTVLNGAQRP